MNKMLATYAAVMTLAALLSVVPATAWLVNGVVPTLATVLP